jgi:uncharacterized phiE125 gp8 family phage protein
MGLALLAAPAVEPVTVPDLRARLSIDGDLADPLLATFLAAARAAVERATRRALLSQTWRWTIDRARSGTALRLPVAPVQAVTAVTVTAADGATVPFEGPRAVDLTTDPARLVFTADAPRPGVPLGGIAVDILAGYGPAPEAVPEPLRQAVAMLAGHWYADRGREPTSTMPPAVAELVGPWRRAGLLA